MTLTFVSPTVEPFCCKKAAVLVFFHFNRAFLLVDRVFLTFDRGFSTSDRFFSAFDRVSSLRSGFSPSRSGLVVQKGLVTLPTFPTKRMFLYYLKNVTQTTSGTLISEPILESFPVSLLRVNRTRFPVCWLDTIM